MEYLNAVQLNGFINYLNSLIRLNGSNENALAEFQASSPYFHHIAVPHPLQATLADDMRRGQECIILTGHAGDGKTTLAFAVYRELCGLDAVSPLANAGQSIIDFTFGQRHGLLIKDLSERDKNEDDKLMARLLCASASPLLVSNTGALLEFFREREKDSSEKARLESELLEKLRDGQGAVFIFRGRQFKIYNLANYRNLTLAQQALAKMLEPHLWHQCQACARQKGCPVHFNVRALADDTSQARRRMFLAYERLHAYGARLTMRQLTEHMAYCITGGLPAEQICGGDGPPPLGSRHHFYNLFFGGAGAENLAAIAALARQKLGHDLLPAADRELWRASHAAPAPYSLPPYVQPIFEHCRKLGASRQNVGAPHYRAYARRMLYFFSQSQDHEWQERLLGESLRSPGLLIYKSLPLSRRRRGRLMDCLFHVLQEHFTGMRLPAAIGKTDGKFLYITLHRPNHFLRQSVQAVLCRLAWDDNFDLREAKASDGEPKLLLAGKGNLGGMELLELSIPFLDYMLARHAGSLDDMPRAAFAQQLDNLKAKIIRKMRQTEAEDNLALLRCRSDYSLRLDKCYLDDKGLEVERGSR